METWLLEHRLVSVCFIFTFLSTAFGDEIYFRTQSNSSIEFSCEAPAEPSQPFAFTLNREGFQKGKVLYQNFNLEPTVHDPSYAGRIRANTSHKERFQRVHVSIMHLQTYDTDVYGCIFHYDTPTGFKNLSGRNKVFLYITDCYIKPCSCSSYTPLLYSLSAAAGLLFLIILIITAMHCIKAGGGGQSKPQLPVPIYEEMNGVRGKQSSGSQEYDISPLYNNPKKENPYIN